VDALNEKTAQMQKAITEMQTQTRQVRFFSFEYFPMIITLLQQRMTGIDWMMKEMDRAKMSS
jgi:hypothetical protein